MLHRLRPACVRPGPRPSQRDGRGGRDLHRWRGAWAGRWAAERQEGARRRRRATAAEGASAAPAWSRLPARRPRRCGPSWLAGDGCSAPVRARSTLNIYLITSTSSASAATAARHATAAFSSYACPTPAGARRRPRPGTPQRPHPRRRGAPPAATSLRAGAGTPPAWGARPPAGPGAAGLACVAPVDRGPQGDVVARHRHAGAPAGTDGGRGAVRYAASSATSAAGALRRALRIVV
jgi:hypothetical protein